MIVKMKTLTIKKHLARRNLSYNSFARHARISGPYFSQLIRGLRFPSPDVRAKIMKALNESQKLQSLPPFQFDDLFIIEGR